MEIYSLTVYIPDTHVEEVKQALFKLGVGDFGNYTHCCWQTHGLGQFKANNASKPYVGQKDIVHKEPEVKVELILQAELIPAARQAIIDTHPYETPAYHFIRILT